MINNSHDIACFWNKAEEINISIPYNGFVNDCTQQSLLIITDNIYSHICQISFIITILFETDRNFYTFTQKAANPSLTPTFA